MRSFRSLRAEYCTCSWAVQAVPVPRGVQVAITVAAAEDSASPLVPLVAEVVALRTSDGVRASSAIAWSSRVAGAGPASGNPIKRSPNLAAEALGARSARPAITVAAAMDIATAKAAAVAPRRAVAKAVAAGAPLGCTLAAPEETGLDARAATGATAQDLPATPVGRAAGAEAATTAVAAAELEL